MPLLNNILDGVQREIIPISLFSPLISLATMILALTLYTMGGHYYIDDRFFPTISNTERHPPEKYVYVIGFTYCGIALCLIASVVHLRMIGPALKEKRKWAYWMNNVSLVLGLISGICFTLQTYWPVGHFMHSSGSGAFFYLGLVYCILVAVVTRTPECRALGFEKMWKAKVWMTSVYALCVGLFGLGLLDSYANRKTFVYYYVETLSEWGAVYAFILHSATYCFDAMEYNRITKEKTEGGEKMEESEEAEGSIPGRDIVLTELGDEDGGSPSLDDEKKSSQCGMPSVREGVEELLTVVISSREGSAMEQTEGIGEGIGFDSPLIEKKFDLSERIEKVLGTTTYKVIPLSYVSLLAFSIGEFLVLKAIF